MLEKLPSNFKASLHGKELLPVPTAKNLGLVIDSSLSFNEHVTQTALNVLQALAKSELGSYYHVYIRQKDSKHYN